MIRKFFIIKMKAYHNTLTSLIFCTTLLVLGACVTDPGVSKNRGQVKDFSLTDGKVGCDKNYLVLSQPDTCVSSCGTNTGYHLATDTELADAKKTTDQTLLAKINGSAGICVDDKAAVVRPTNQIDIKSDFCSCISGKPDIISDCTTFCSNAPVSTSPTLYLNTVMGPDIALNTKLGNLYNWCSVQLEGDTTSPQCFLSASDGTNTISNIPVTIAAGSNSLSANIQQLALNKTYIVKIVEGKSGSNSQSKEFQLRRVSQTTDTGSLIGALKVTPINQYTCMTYGGVTSGNTVIRTNFARVFYYFASNEVPPPIPPAGGSNQSQVVCHDEQLHPGNDSAEYPRLEFIPQHFAMWDKADPRFVNENNTGMTINKTIKTRLLNEFGVSMDNLGLFTLINYPNRPTTTATSTANIPVGYMMIPFTDTKTGNTFCPTQTNFNSNDPLFNLLKEYMDDTEGLYLAEKEAETIEDGSSYKTIYGTMFITESVLKKYAFYIENGLKIRADQSAMNTKTVYYYWPTSETADPLTQGNRRLFTVRSPDSLNGNVPTGQSTTQRTTDKRIGCVPKSN